MTLGPVAARTPAPAFEAAPSGFALPSPQERSGPEAIAPVVLADAGATRFFPAKALGAINAAQWPGIDYLSNRLDGPPAGSVGLRPMGMPESNPLERGLNDRIIVSTARALERMTDLPVLPTRSERTHTEEYRNPAGMPELRTERDYQLFVKGDPDAFKQRFLAAGGNAALEDAVRRDVYRSDIGHGILNGVLNNVLMPLIRQITGDRQPAI